MKRRQFLSTSAIAGTAVLVAPSSVLAKTSVTSAASGSGGVTGRARSHAREWLAERLHTQFDIDTPRGVVAAELVAIEEGPVGKGLDQFTAVFRAPSDSDVEGIRTVGHRADQIPLFFDRTHDVGGSRLCKAPFSLLLQ